MQRRLALLAAALCVTSAAARAQAPARPAAAAPVVPLPDLTVTLPTGKVVTFPSAEAKARYLAALERAKAGAATSPGPTPPARDPAKVLGRTSMDADPGKAGVGNPGAPIFTAAYYLGGKPETWLGKKITLAVAYLTPTNQPARSDGLRQLVAATWNGSPGQAGEQAPGGQLTILASPDQAQKLLALCGSNLNTLSGNVRVSMIHGEFGRATAASGESSGEGQYCLYVR